MSIGNGGIIGVVNNPSNAIAKGVFSLQEQLKAKKAGNWPFPTSFPVAIGAAFGGGFFAGQIGTSDIATHNLVVGPKSSAQTTGQYKNALTLGVGADSNINGPQNTADMVADGNATVYPCAHFCNNAVIGGFSDWYMPATNELDVCYFHLKPTTQATTTSTGFSTGTNPNAIPSRATNAIFITATQTSAAAFQEGGAEAFDTSFYWSSTKQGAPHGYIRYFTSGYKSIKAKTDTVRVRCIRRVAV